MKQGADGFELDVTLSADGVPVVIHDDKVDRTTNGCGLVTSHTLAALRELDAGSWFGAQFEGERIPAFDEVLTRYNGRVHIHTEIKGKSPSLSQRTADLIRKQGMERQVTVTSFQSVRLEEMRAYAPELPMGWLVREVNDSIIAQAHAISVTQLCPRADTVTPELVHRLHVEGFVARAWGVATEELMQRLVQAGVDGMTVNFPDKLIAYLDAHNYLWE